MKLRHKQWLRFPKATYGGVTRNVPQLVTVQLWLFELSRTVRSCSKRFNSRNFPCTRLCASVYLARSRVSSLRISIICSSILPMTGLVLESCWSKLPKLRVTPASSASFSAKVCFKLARRVKLGPAFLVLRVSRCFVLGKSVLGFVEFFSSLIDMDGQKMAGILNRRAFWGQQLFNKSVTHRR